MVLREATVKTRVGNVLMKLRLGNRVQAVVVAYDRSRTWARTRLSWPSDPVELVEKGHGPDRAGANAGE